MSLNSKRPNTAHQGQYPKSLIADLKGQMESFPQGPLAGANSSKFKKIIGLGFLLICALSLGYLAYNAFKYSNLPTSIDEIPLIKADHNPTRIVPTDPGGERVLNQDKLIYNNLQDPHFKREKKPNTQIEDEMQSRSASLRAPKQALPVKPKKPGTTKNPFEILDEER